VQYIYSYIVVAVSVAVNVVLLPCLALPCSPFAFLVSVDLIWLDLIWLGLASLAKVELLLLAAPCIVLVFLADAPLRPAVLVLFR